MSELDRLVGGGVLGDLGMGLGSEGGREPGAGRDGERGSEGGGQRGGELVRGEQARRELASRDQVSGDLAGRDQVSAEKMAGAQQTALELLVEGKSVAETARTSGVSRGTIYNWMKRDANFQAAYNQWREQMEESSRSRMLAVMDKAAGALEKGFEAGDARTALMFLKGMGVIAPPRARATDAEEIAEREELEERERKIRIRSAKARVDQDDSFADFGV